MADRSGTGSYTPNRKPRRGRGGSTPRGSPRGRGQQPAGDTVVQPEPPVVAASSSPGITGQEKQASLADPKVSKTTTESLSPSKVENPQEKTISVPTTTAKMESPNPDKTIASATSMETFMTPPSITETESDTNVAKSTEKSLKSLEVPPESEKDAGDETPSTKSSELPTSPSDQPAPSSSSSLVPEKPPRKISTEKAVKVYIAPEVEKPKTPRSTGEPPLSVEIDTETDVVSGSLKRAGSLSGPSPISHSGLGRRASGKMISPGSHFPIGYRPGYGITVHDDDSSSPNLPSRSTRNSIAEIKVAAKTFSRRQWITLIIFGLADLLCAMVISLQAPYYPSEAESKGATSTEYGLVFGIYELTVFLTSPIYGKYMNKLGPRAVFNSGIALTSISCIAFGFLDKVDGRYLFIGLSFVLRITEGIGASGFVTASFSILSYEFPDSVATTFASLETFFGLGLIIGPTVGGALYQVGGFYLPFVVVGVMLLLVAIASLFVMPQIEMVEDADGRATEGYNILKILRIPGVFIAAISIALAANSLSFLSATLEPHLRQFNLTPLQIGLIFIINGGTYALTAPLFGYFCDTLSRPVFVSLFGAVLVFLSFFIIGPAPFIPMNTILWVTGVGLFIQGLGLAATLVSGFISALKDSMDYGFPDNLLTYGVVAGLWTAFLSLGAFVGPSVGGILLDFFGFRDSTYYILITQFLVILLIIIYIAAIPKPKSHDTSESQPLLREISPILSQKEDLEIPIASTSAGYGTIGDSQA